MTHTDGGSMRLGHSSGWGPAGSRQAGPDALQRQEGKLFFFNFQKSTALLFHFLASNRPPLRSGRARAEGPSAETPAGQLRPPPPAPQPRGGPARHPAAHAQRRERQLPAGTAAGRASALRGRGALMQEASAAVAGNGRRCP